jgi:hypothetical protein
MVNQFKKGLDQKQRTGLFGIIKGNVYAKEDLKSATKFPDCVPVEAIKSYQIRAEEEKARATEFILRRTSIT